MTRGSVLFDFFGTLVTYDASMRAGSLDAHIAFARTLNGEILEAEAERAWLETWASLEERARSSGREYSMDDLAEAYARGLGHTAVAGEDTARFIDDFFNQWCAPIRPAPGVHEVLAALAKDHELLVVSNTHHSPLVPKLLAQFDLGGYFSAVILSLIHI